MGIPTREGTSYWQRSAIRYILQNEKYVGDSLLQKWYSMETFPVRRKRNEGERTQYLLSNSHPAIIDRETFEKAQSLHKMRTVGTEKRPNGSYKYSMKIVCGSCGAYFGRKAGRGVVYWVCRTHDKNKSECDVGRFQESVFDDAFRRMYYKLKQHTDSILEKCWKNFIRSVTEEYFGVRIL